MRWGDPAAKGKLDTDEREKNCWSFVLEYVKEENLVQK